MMDRRNFLFSGGSVLVQPFVQVRAQTRQSSSLDVVWLERWRQRLAELERDSGGRLGVAMHDTGTGAYLGWRDAERFAMCSTFKLLLAGWMLWLVDQGKESLTQRIHYPESSLVTYSPISGPHAGKNGLTVAELCAACVSWSDNTAANVLLSRHGGPLALTAFLRSLADPVTRLDRFELDLNNVAPGDTRDTTTPQAMLSTTEKLVVGDVLSCDSRAHLRYWLRDCRTGDNRLRAGAPGWLVGDKTGTFEKDGIANDVAVLWPSAQEAPTLIACYLDRGRGSGADRDAIVAEVARTVLSARADFRAF